MIIYAYLFSVIYNAISERHSKSIEATKYKKLAKYYFRTWASSPSWPPSS